MVHDEDATAPPDSATVAPLSAIAEAFEELAKRLNEDEKNGPTQQDQEEQLRIDKFCHAFSLVSVLFNYLGLVFKFAEMEYVSKVLFLYLFFLILMMEFDVIVYNSWTLKKSLN